MPSRYGIEWAPAAQADMDELLAYIATRDCADAAMHMYEKLMDKIETLVLHPGRCRVPPELKRLGIAGYHELVVSPYGVFFRIRENHVGIIAILDRRRDLEEFLVQRIMRT